MIEIDHRRRSNITIEESLPVYFIILEGNSMIVISWLTRPMAQIDVAHFDAVLTNKNKNSHNMKSFEVSRKNLKFLLEK